MSVAALPQWLAGNKRQTRVWLIVGAVIAALAGVLYMGFSPKDEPGVSAISAQIYEVTPIDLEIKVTKDGEIQAINNIDVNCQVEGVSTITTIVKEGNSVKKGDVLLTLDSTQIRQKLEDTSLELQKAEADVSNATEMLEIQKNTNATSLESAQVTKSLAELDLKQYEEGTYPQQLVNAQTEVVMDKTAMFDSAIVELNKPLTNTESSATSKDMAAAVTESVLHTNCLCHCKVPEELYLITKPAV